MVASGLGVWLPGGRDVHAQEPPRDRKPGEPQKFAFIVAKETPEDVFTVTSEVKHAAPPRFGVNLKTQSRFNPHRFRLFNSYVTSWSMEPMHVVHQFWFRDPTGSTPTIIRSRDPKYGISGSKVSCPADMMTGARHYHFRLTDGEFRLIHASRVTEYHARKNPEDTEMERQEWYRIAEPGPVPQENDYALLEKTVANMPFPPDPKTQKYALLRHFIIDLGEKAPDAGSTASARFDLPGGAWHGFEAMFPGKHWPADGTAMKAEFWARQEGIAGGKVTLKIPGQITRGFDVGATWEKYECEFIANRSKVAKGVNYTSIGSAEKGTLWLDNFLVYRKDLPPFAPLPEHVQALKALRPGCLRIWSGLSAGPLRMATGVLADEMVKPRNYQSVSLGRMLELAEEVGADVWFILNRFMTDEDVNALMEYLGAPVDTGLGKLRASQGRPGPWTDAFGKIYIECDNERMFYSSIENYTAMARHMFRIVRESPHFEKDKFLCVANNWGIYMGSGWGEKVVRQCPEADIYDVGQYIGGSDGVTSVGEDDDELMQANLLNAEHVYGNQKDRAFALRDEILGADAARRPYTFAIYEGGCGSTIGRLSPEDRNAMETITKSLVGGMAILDSYMDAQDRGYGDCLVFNYGPGSGGWSTHNTDFTPHVYMLALQMRNLYCRGDLMKVEPTSVKTIDIPPLLMRKMDWLGRFKNRRMRGRQGILLTRCYAYRGGKRHSVLLYNLSFTEPRAIVLRLPYDPRPAAKGYFLQHANPRTTNRDGRNVEIREEALNDFAREFTLTLPPASACVLVSEEQ